VVLGLGRKSPSLVAAVEDTLYIDEKSGEVDTARSTYHELAPGFVISDDRYNHPLPPAQPAQFTRRIELWSDGPRLVQNANILFQDEPRDPILLFGSFEGTRSRCGRQMCQLTHDQASQTHRTPLRQALRASLPGLLLASAELSIGAMVSALLVTSGASAHIAAAGIVLGVVTLVGCGLLVMRAIMQGVHRAWQTSVVNKEAHDWALLLRFADLFIDGSADWHVDRDSPIFNALKDVPEPKPYAASIKLQEHLGHSTWPKWSASSPFYLESHREMTPLIQALSGDLLLTVAEQQPQKSRKQKLSSHSHQQWGMLLFDAQSAPRYASLWQYLSKPQRVRADLPDDTSESDASSE
jgi:hypothetical protein